MAEKAVGDSLTVTALLVVHDGAVWLPEVVASLTSQTRLVDEVLAINTGSIDASEKLLKGARVPVLSLDRETGFGDAIWSGLQTLPEGDDESKEWLWILHDDCALDPHALEKLVEAVESRPQVAMAGPKLLGWHDRTHLLEIGISIATNGARWTGLEQHEYDQGQHDGVKEVLAVSTAGALIRRDVFEELGGFDPNLSLFRDDVDFGWRVRVAGHSVIAVTDAKAYHAEASASERRAVDVKDALLHRPLLLDRRHAAYVLLANSSWWTLPVLVFRLLTSSAARALGYLLAKLPGYAGDEVLAIATLVIHPRELIRARKFRRKHRLVSPRVVREFIPPRLAQMRMALERGFEIIREKVLPPAEIDSRVLDPLNEDEDLLAPTTLPRWWTLLKKPKAIAAVAMLTLLLFWSRHRFGTIVGGALPQSPESARDLWRAYFESWHQIGMGSENPSPPWIALLAIPATVVFSKVPFLISVFFFFAPLLFMISSHRLFARVTEHEWLRVGASFLYAISPVAIASINGGRLGTVVALLLLPHITLLAIEALNVDSLSWRKLFTLTLAFALLFAFSIITILFVLAYSLMMAARDYNAYTLDQNKDLYRLRSLKRASLLFTPLLILFPWSFHLLRHPHGFLLDPGLSLSGGGPNYAILLNPGGAGALPWWVISPLVVVLLFSLFSTTRARRIAEYGSAALIGATILSALTVRGNGSETPTRVWVGSLLAITTMAAIAAAIILLDRVREVLVVTNFHYRHILSGLLVLATIFYSLATVAWLFTAGADSPVRHTSRTVLPAFLGAEPGTKTLVLRQVTSGEGTSLQYYFTRGHDVRLGEPDVAPRETEEVTSAVRAIADGSGINSAQILASYGVKYVFAKNPASPGIIQTIDGLGGFVRSSSTGIGTVWKVAGANGRLVYVDPSGARTVLESSEVGARTNVPGPGTLLLSDTFSRSWQVFQDGYKLERIKDANGLPSFTVTQAGEISLVHDGTIRRGLLSLQVIVLITVIVLAAPAGRRKREISEKELT